MEETAPAAQRAGDDLGDPSFPGKRKPPHFATSCGIEEILVEPNVPGQKRTECFAS